MVALTRFHGWEADTEPEARGHHTRSPLSRRQERIGEQLPRSGSSGWNPARTLRKGCSVARSEARTTSVRQVCPKVLASVLRCMERWEDGRPPLVCRETGDSCGSCLAGGRGCYSLGILESRDDRWGSTSPSTDGMAEGRWRGSSLPKVTWRPPDCLESGFRSIGPPLGSGSSRSKGPLMP